MIRPGSALRVRGRRLVVGEPVGQGGEGTVYAVHEGDAAPTFALKWYFEHTAVEQRRHALTELVERGAPHERFLWPLGLIEPSAGSSFGYLMRFRPDGYVGLAKLLSLEVPRHEERVVHLAFEVAHSFLALHALGLCYRDISFGNVFFDPATGHAMICDNDNAGIDGASRPLVRGTPKFMAPEVVRGETSPSKRTDHYSLAVLLFYLLFVGHPLEGCRTEDVLADRLAHHRFYGHEPRFCFDPDDETNRPVPGLHDHVATLWHSVPAFVRELFLRCFTDGLRDPRSRVSDSEWCDAMVRLRDVMYPCPGCGLPRYHDAGGGPPPACARCGDRSAPAAVLRVGHHRLVVSPLARITAHHLRHDFDAGTTVAAAEPHPTRPTVMGLRNDTGHDWRFRSGDGRDGTVPPGRRVRLSLGMIIDMGSHTASVEPNTIG
jgi:DNA-binding helix-hairpin-helix protein with protein kinase domain